MSNQIKKYTILDKDGNTIKKIDNRSEHEKRIQAFAFLTSEALKQFLNHLNRKR